MNNTIHNSAIVDPSVKIGSNNIISEGVIIRKGVFIGDNNIFGPYCIIGDPPESRNHIFKSHYGVKIGNDNYFTKKVSVDAGTCNPTTITNNCLLLADAYIGHDSFLHEWVTMTAGSKIGGFVTLNKHVTLGLNSSVHQRLEVPEGVILGMNSAIVKNTEMTSWIKLAGVPAKFIGKNFK